LIKNNFIINTIPLLSPLTGIGRYTYEISKKIKDDNDLDTYFFYGYYSKNILDIKKTSKSKILKKIITKNQLIKKISRKLLLHVSKFYSPAFDLYWEPNFIPLENIKAKKIVTSVHDFSFILHKEYHPKERIEYFENNFFKKIYISDAIICFSEFTKNEILERLNIDQKKIKVIYHGLDHNLFKIKKDLKVNFELPKKFILCVGSIEPRKNLISLLKAYNNLDMSIKKEYKLILTGFKGWENQEIVSLINQNKDYVNYLGYISDEELVAVYNLATLFVYPSFYEGFGLPVLEAMACGTPVVCSNTTSLPEVGGDAVVYCNPYNINHIKERIEMVLNDEKIQKEMIVKGLERAKQFTWEKSAKKHLEVFKEVLEN
jgi:glycosyltransferase involved in cell wall biosynthesis